MTGNGWRGVLETVHSGGMADDSSPVSRDRTDTGLRQEGITRSFGWSNMFVRPEDDPRADEGFHGERSTLAGYLRDYRLTIELKCSGLDAAAMARRSVEPSDMSLLGLVRHLADVERHWFRRDLGGQDASPLYQRDDDRDAAFDGAVARLAGGGALR